MNLQLNCCGGEGSVLPDFPVKVPAGIKVTVYPQTAPPVFFGHYWLEDKFPVIQAANVICLDYSVAKNGSLVAYQWSGEDVIDNEHFVWVR